jgi:hypothetical protein
MAIEDEIEKVFEAGDFRDILNKCADRIDEMETLIVGWRNHSGEVNWKSASHDQGNIIHIANAIIFDTLMNDFKDGV